MSLHQETCLGAIQNYPKIAREARCNPFDAARPDWLIHCAALSILINVRKILNVPAVKHCFPPLAEACASRNIAFVHISTDAVFDGEKEGYYTEADDPRPLNVYAQTKLEGEKAVLKTNPRAIVVRVNFYGWSLSGKRSLAEFFFYNLIEKNNIRIIDVLFPCRSTNWHEFSYKCWKNLAALPPVDPRRSRKYIRRGIARLQIRNPNLISPKSVGSCTLHKTDPKFVSSIQLLQQIGTVFPIFPQV
jgi:dTDP-4-dehydrorhamnose reductase